MVEYQDASRLPEDRIMPLCRLCILLLALTSVAAGQADDARDAILRRFADEFVLLTPGKDKYPASFQMGSETDGKPVRTVTFAYPFAIAKYEVTQELYQAIMGNNPSKWKGKRNSVELMTWDQANEFCQKATTELRQKKLIGDKATIRLPSEAEWEYACRAGTTTAYSFGDDVKQLGEYAWFKGNAAGNDPPVGMKKPNPWGLYDMHGYIWEWCADAWHPSYEGAPSDGSARTQKDAKERVLRGGAWSADAAAARSAFRFKATADARTDGFGFRCVKVEGN
jgi:formylglycine-generating enzyme required for sulfatase activity